MVTILLNYRHLTLNEKTNICKDDAFKVLDCYISQLPHIKEEILKFLSLGLQNLQGSIVNLFWKLRDWSLITGREGGGYKTGGGGM